MVKRRSLFGASQVRLAIVFTAVLLAIFAIYTQSNRAPVTLLTHVPAYPVMTTPAPTPMIDLVQRLSMAQRIAQMFMIRVSGPALDPQSAELIHTMQPGGVILMHDNITDIATTRALVDAIQRELTIPAFIAVDQEGGTVLRLPWDAHPEITGDHTDALAQIHAQVNLAPVLDRETPTGYIRTRTLATDSASIVRKASPMIALQRTRQIASVGKHFPGIGHAIEDPHARIPTIATSIVELQEDMAPFIQLAPQLDMIMSSHVRFVAYDSLNPATFSYELLTRQLRERIGYAGIIITDDLNMESVVGQRDKYIRALQAGNDMLLTLEPSNQIQLAFGEIAGATLSGRLRTPFIDASAARILQLKRTLGLIQ